MVVRACMQPHVFDTLADALSQYDERHAVVAAVSDQLSVQITGVQRYITDVVGGPNLYRQSGTSRRVGCHFDGWSGHQSASHCPACISSIL
jgi:hypothetical protein